MEENEGKHNNVSASLKNAIKISPTIAIKISNKHKFLTESLFDFIAFLSCEI